MRTHSSHPVISEMEETERRQTLHFNMLMSKSKDFKAGLLVIVTTLTMSSKWLKRISALWVKWILAEKSQSVRTAAANTAVLQQCTWICSPLN